MKYKIITEKLDWKGKVVREVRDFEDQRFVIDVGAMLSDFVAKGELDFSLAKPKFDFRELLDAAVAGHGGFNRYEPGVTMVVSEHIPSISAQFVVYNARRESSLEPIRWVRTDKDLAEKEMPK